MNEFLDLYYSFTISIEDFLCVYVCDICLHILGLVHAERAKVDFKFLSQSFTFIVKTGVHWFWQTSWPESFRCPPVSASLALGSEVGSVVSGDLSADPRFPTLELHACVASTLLTESSPQTNTETQWLEILVWMPNANRLFYFLKSHRTSIHILYDSFLRLTHN